MAEIPKHIPEERINKRNIKETVKNSTPEALIDVPRNGAGFEITPPDHLISLSTFTELCDTPFMKHYVDKSDIETLRNISNPARRKSKAEIKESEKIRDVKNKIDEAIYGQIQNEFRLESKREASEFFQSKWKQGLSAVEQHFSNVYGQPASISDELKRKQTPSRLIQLLVSNDTADELKYQIKTNLLLARIAGEIELSAKGAEKKLKQLQDLLNDKLYVGQIGETKEVTKYGIFNTRNELIGFPQDSQPTPKETPAGTHYKEVSARTRTVELNNKKTHVVQIANEKSMETSIEKALRKALKAKQKGKGEEIKSGEYVQDTHRMMFIVYGDEQDAEALRQKLAAVIIDNSGHFETRTPDNITIEDETKSDEEGKSDEFERIQMEIKFKDIQKPIEVIIQTLPQYLRAYSIGTYKPNKDEVTGPKDEVTGPKDEVTGPKDEVTGPNHKIMEVVRARPLNEILRAFQPPTKFNPNPAGSRMRPPLTVVQKRMEEAKEQKVITIG